MKSVMNAFNYWNIVFCIKNAKYGGTSKFKQPETTSQTKLYNRCLDTSMQKANGNKSEVQMIHFQKIQC